MHIILHLLAFVLAAVWIIGFFFYHASGVIHVVLIAAILAFVFAILKRPGRRTV